MRLRNSEYDPFHPDATLRRGSLSAETISLYRDASLICGEQHLTSTAQGSLNELDQWTRRIQADIQRSPGKQQTELLAILWTFYNLLAKVYSDDFKREAGSPTPF